MTTATAASITMIMTTGRSKSRRKRTMFTNAGIRNIRIQ
jgi:hypothetical protein